MGGSVEVNPAQVHATADWLSTSAQDFRDELSALMKEVRSFVGGDWQGMASGSHSDAWDEWEEGARQIIAGLEHDADALHRAAATLHNTDQGSADSISSTTSERA
ncbi:WXG100 family type VII secretion target [Nocardia nova]|uniref:WXG100 family type VII secretion target n=1 Tax=Nocardia nova TaxID=37330 RepID=UPI0015E351CD|nr:WXG100 family type VII secretion target [Nocardia nova]